MMVKSSESISADYPWKMQYDSTMQQYYYINTDDNTVSFDSPCEVAHKKEANKPKSLFNMKRKSIQETTCQMNRSDSGKKRNVLSRIGSVLSIRSSKSYDSNDEPATPISPIISNGRAFVFRKESRESIIGMKGGLDPYEHIDIDDTDSIDTRIDDEYLLDNPANYKNFAGTSMNYYASDLESVSSSESIQSYYSDLNSYYYQSDNGKSTNFNLTFDKEEERRQLRLQMLRELEI